MFHILGVAAAAVAGVAAGYWLRGKTVESKPREVKRQDPPEQPSQTGSDHSETAHGTVD